MSLNVILIKCINVFNLNSFGIMYQRVSTDVIKIMLDIILKFEIEWLSNWKKYMIVNL